MVIIFGYEFDRRVVRQPGVQYRCAGLLGTPNKALDFTVLEVAQGNRDISEWGQLELSAEPASGKLFIIQHPGGDLKKVVQKDCEVTTRDAENRRGEQNDFGHKCDTEDGSSGSPVFDSMHRVIGLHHLGWRRTFRTGATRIAQSMPIISVPRSRTEDQPSRRRMGFLDQRPRSRRDANSLTGMNVRSAFKTSILPWCRACKFGLPAALRQCREKSEFNVL